MTSRGPRDLPRSPATSHNLRVQLMAHQRLLELAPPADGIAAVLSSRRAYKGMGKKAVRRAILNEPELVQAIHAAFADVRVRVADFGALSLSEQMAATRVARLLFGAMPSWGLAPRTSRLPVNLLLTRSGPMSAQACTARG